MFQRSLIIRSANTNKSMKNKIKKSNRRRKVTRSSEPSNNTDGVHTIEAEGKLEKLKIEPCVSDSELMQDTAVHDFSVESQEDLVDIGESSKYFDPNINLKSNNNEIVEDNIDIELNSDNNCDKDSKNDILQKPTQPCFDESDLDKVLKICQTNADKYNSTEEGQRFTSKCVTENNRETEDRIFFDIGASNDKDTDLSCKVFMAEHENNDIKAKLTDERPEYLEKIEDVAEFNILKIDQKKKSDHDVIESDKQSMNKNPRSTLYYQTEDNYHSGVSELVKRRLDRTNNDSTHLYNKRINNTYMENSNIEHESISNNLAKRDHAISFITEPDSESLAIHIHGQKTVQNNKSLLDYTTIGPVLMKNTGEKGGYHVNKIDLSMREKVKVTLFQNNDKTRKIMTKTETPAAKVETKKITISQLHKLYMKNHFASSDAAKYRSSVDVRYVEDDNKKSEGGKLKNFFMRLLGKKSH